MADLKADARLTFHLVSSPVLGDGIELRVARFDPSQGPDEWLDGKATGISHRQADKADTAGRGARPGRGSYAAADFVCWERGLRDRVAWTDLERGLAGVLISETAGIDELYTLWRDPPA